MQSKVVNREERIEKQHTESFGTHFGRLVIDVQLYNANKISFQDLARRHPKAKMGAIKLASNWQLTTGEK